MTVLRSLLFNTLFMTSLVVVGLGCLPVLLVSRPAARQVSLLFGRWLLWLARHLVGLSVDLRGRQYISCEPTIYAAKHQSALETFVLSLVLRQADFVVKRELLMVPVAGWFIAAQGAVPVDRGGGARALKAMLRHARASVAKGRSIVIFPEGTRTEPGAERAYHPGVAALYADLGLAVVPIAVNTGLYWRRRGFLKHAGTAVVAFLEPILPGLDRGAFMAELHDRIERASAQLVSEAG
jgi:1-acyl-sn-glycerol-3-phosphate acyltransferase